MGLLMQSQEEYDYCVDNLREAMALVGQDGFLYQIDEKYKDLYKDPTVTYKEKVSIGMLFEDNPKPLLKKYGWSSEDNDDPGLVAYIVMMDNNGNALSFRDQMVVEIVSKYGIRASKYYEVMKIQGNSIDPMMYICKLVPYRFKVDNMPETETVEPYYNEKPNNIRATHLKKDF